MYVFSEIPIVYRGDNLFCLFYLFVVIKSFICNYLFVARDLMIVSTLDGKVSALDLHNAGSVQWTLDTDIGPLMDSSISKLEVSL